MDGIDFVSLQKEVGPLDAALLRTHDVAQPSADFADFADTAVVIAMLDLIISVDTSVVHLAGAMGKPVALLLPFSPDFRWMFSIATIRRGIRPCGCSARPRSATGTASSRACATRLSKS